MSNSLPGPNVVTSVTTQPVSSNQALRLLASVIGVNCNVTGDLVIPIVNASPYAVDVVIFTNASTSLTTAAAGLFPAPGATGTAIVSNAALSGLTGSTIVSKRTIASETALTVQNLYLNFGTAQGAAATMDVFIYGYVLASLS